MNKMEEIAARAIEAMVREVGTTQNLKEAQEACKDMVRALGVWAGHEVDITNPDLKEEILDMRGGMAGIAARDELGEADRNRIWEAAVINIRNVAYGDDVNPDGQEALLVLDKLGRLTDEEKEDLAEDAMTNNDMWMCVAPLLAKMTLRESLLQKLIENGARFVYKSEWFELLKNKAVPAETMNKIWDEAGNLIGARSGDHFLLCISILENPAFGRNKAWIRKIEERVLAGPVPERRTLGQALLRRPDMDGRFPVDQLMDWACEEMSEEAISRWLDNIDKTKLAQLGSAYRAKFLNSPNRDIRAKMIAALGNTARDRKQSLGSSGR